MTGSLLLGAVAVFALVFAATRRGRGGNEAISPRLEALAATQSEIAGRFAQADAKLLSFAILGAVNWIPRWYNPDGPSSSQEIADRFADYLIAGLRPV